MADRSSSSLPDTPAVRYMAALRLGLRERGYVERKNIIIEHRLSRAPKDNAAIECQRWEI